MKLLLLLFLLVTTPAFGMQLKDSIPNLMNQALQNIDKVSASFTQIKTFPESSKQFKANGYIKFIKGTGLLWKQTTPTNNTFTTTTSSYCINGQKKELNNLPYFSDIQEIIHDIFQGDISTFIDIFDTEYTETNKKWTLTATPKINDLSEVLKQITFNGTNKEILNITIVYTNNSTIKLTFKLLTKELPDEISC